MQRVTSSLSVVAVALTSLIALGIAFAAGDGIPGWMRVLLPAAWLAAVAFFALLAYAWPPLHYRHTSYRVDHLGIEIRRGVYWRVVINVPRSRVQHIDVQSGPIDRRYRLGTLVVYTAGTDHAKVVLAGLEHGRALRIREHLLPSGADDAV